MLNILYFTATWCNPCKAFGPVIDQVIQEMGVSITKIDVDMNQSSVLKYDIVSVPTLVFVDQNTNTILYKKTGIVPKSELISLISKFK